MAEYAKGKSQIDIDSLRETLCAQQRLLQKLYYELDAEREASSTAASEALSMIIRLQGEKAAVKMEAEQYKRMVEEKMCHAEESLAIFEDIMYQKEIELAALDYQVQAYRHKLISLGCVDPGNGEIKFPENLLQRTETKTGDIPPPLLSRRNSAPMLLPPKYPHSRKGIDEILSKDAEDCSDSNSESGKKADISSGAGDIYSYWEEIRKLDGRVKEIAGVRFENWQGSTRSPSPASEYSANSYDPTKHPEEVAAECSSSYPGVLDVFEVPQTDKNCDSSKLCTRNQVNMILGGEDKLQKPDSVSDEIVMAESAEDETDWIKSMLKSSSYNKRRNLTKPRDSAAIDCNMAMTNVSECSNRLHQINYISEIEVEGEAVAMESSGRQEELKLLHEITEQLNSIKLELRSLRPRKRSQEHDLAFTTLVEVYIYNIYIYIQSSACLPCLFSAFTFCEILMLYDRKCCIFGCELVK